MVSGYPTSTSFPRVDGWSIDPRVLGHHKVTSFPYWWGGPRVCGGGGGGGGVGRVGTGVTP